MSLCLAEDDLLELTRGRALSDAPDVEAHLADCQACSALLVALLDPVPPDPGASPPRWGALSGRALGPYRLDAQIGAGAMGAVYRAWDERLCRNVAVKVLPAHAAGSAELARRLGIEARAAAAIAHPNVVTIYDVGSADGVAFVVEELCSGESLRSVLGRGPVPGPDALRLGLDLSRGLAAAHAKGVVHRDLKPENLLVTDDGALKILDFGLAKLHGDAGFGLDATTPGAVQGTAGYMAPEQARGEPADTRCDLFAVGAILYELATGLRAFDGASHAERLSAVLRDTPPLDGEALGPLAKIIARCLDKDPKRRFQSAQDLAWVLEGLLGPAPVATAAPAAPPLGDARPTAAPPGGVSRRAFLMGATATGVAGFVLGRWLLGRVPAAAPAQPAFQQLTYRSGRLMSARFTRDGGSILYGAAWDSDPLATYSVRLDGGVARPLELPSADILAVSARGEIALSVGRRYVEGQCALGKLAVAPLDVGAPRILLDDVQDADFTPDGRELAITRREGRRFRLELPAGRALLDVDGWITHPRVAPDGRHIACLLHPSIHDDRGDLVVVEIATGRSRTLSAGWDSIAGLAWDPGGGTLWFSAARVGARSAVHTITLDGRERTVAQTTGRLRVHDLTADRRVAVTVDTWRLRTLVGAPLAPPSAEMDRSLSDFSLVADISTDGRTLLVGEFGDVQTAIGAYLRPVDGGAPLHVGVGLPLALSPSKERVAALLPGGAKLLVVYSTANAGQPEVALGPITSITSARFIDETQLVVVGAEKDRAPRLWRLTTAGAPPSPITDEGRFGPCELDASRRWLAFIDRDGRLTVVDLTDHSARVLPSAYPGQVVSAWQTSPESIVIRTMTTPLRLARVDLAGGTAAPYLEIAPPLLGLRSVDSFVLRADGALYAYSYGQELSQLYLMSLGNAV